MVAASSGSFAALGFIGLGLNLAMATLIVLNRNRNATYIFMLNLALSDIESLIGNILGPSFIGLKIIPETDDTMRVISYFNECGFRGANYWMVLIALSRWLCFARKQIFTKLSSGKVLFGICVSIWAGLHILYSPVLFYSDKIVPMYAIYENSTYSHFLKYFDRAHDVGSVVIQVPLQLMACAWVIKMRKTVLTPEMRKYNRVEVRLFIQCLLDSIVYCLMLFFLYAVLFLQIYATWFIAAMIMVFYFNHIDCAIFYLCFNQVLKEWVTRMRGRMCGGSVAPDPNSFAMSQQRKPSQSQNAQHANTRHV